MFVDVLGEGTAVAPHLDHHLLAMPVREARETLLAALGAVVLHG